MDCVAKVFLDAPNVALAERHGVVAADHAFPVAAVQRMVCASIRKTSSTSKASSTSDRLSVRAEGWGRPAPPSARCETAEGQIKIEMADRLDQAAVRSAVELWKWRREQQSGLERPSQNEWRSQVLVLVDSIIGRRYHPSGGYKCTPNDTLGRKPLFGR